MARIIVVDDAMFMRMTLGKILTRAGHTVVAEGENGKEAVELYKLHKPDVVTMDVTMPLMTGIEAVRAIKEFDPQAKIIMCSAMGQQRMIVDAIQAGAKDFIIKPFDETRVVEALVRILNN